jgi:hypothetical protein
VVSATEGNHRPSGETLVARKRLFNSTQILSVLILGESFFIPVSKAKLPPDAVMQSLRKNKPEKRKVAAATTW